MSRRARLALFALAGPGLAAVLVLGFRGLPDFGEYHGVYGLVVNGVELSERHATDMVTALNFDLRAFDTLGEEFILFASVVGVTLLLRHMRIEEERSLARSEAGHRFGGASDALRATSVVLIALLVSLGGYVVLHGALTPGGGFQGGVVLAAALLIVLLAGEYLVMRVVAPHALVEFGEAAGAASYALIGLGGLIFSGVFFHNFIALGTPGKLLSAGTIPLSNIGVGIEVAGAFILLWTEFLDQALVVRGT